MNTRKPTRNEQAEARYALELELAKAPPATLAEYVRAVARAVLRVMVARAVRSLLKSRRRKRRKRRKG